MKKPDFPDNESARIEALNALDILDTDVEERFDRYTRLAKKILDVPIALVSLIDSDRQWFKSCDGLDVRETPREVSFCGHTILDGKLLIVNDALQDERFADNPLVLGEPYIRFYAGYPLSYGNGIKLGTLCVIDTKPRAFDSNQLDSFKDLALLAERELITTQLAILDDLTDISNRRGFKLLAQKSLHICARQNMFASVVFFDLNGFKKINDQFGHAEGDRALIALAQIMKDTFRSSDIFARLGADEFVALLTNTNSQQAEVIVSKFRQAVMKYNHNANRGYHLRFSSGIVGIDPGEGLSIDSALDMADTAMYERKLNVK